MIRRPWLQRFLALLLGLVSTSPSLAADRVKVVTTLPDLAWAARIIGGDLVDVASLLSGHGDPHDARPRAAFVREVAAAQVVCLVGSELEAGWLPAVLARAGNAQVRPGGKGYCDLSLDVPIKEKPAVAFDLSRGDVHPFGNPHYWLSPKAFAAGSRAIAEALVRVDPAHATAYDQGLARLTRQLDDLDTRTAAVLAPLVTLAGGQPIVLEYHKEFAYFLEDYGLRSGGSIEARPGLMPSAGRLAEVVATAKSAGVRVVLAAEDDPGQTLARFHELSGIPVVVVPTMVQPDGSLTTYPDVQLHLASALVRGVFGTNAAAKPHG